MIFASSYVAVALCAATALVNASPIDTNVEERAACYSGPYVIYARGTDSSHTNYTTPDPNPTDSALANIAASGIPSASAIQPLWYPASGNNPPNYEHYTTSWGIGIDNLQGNITKYVNNCPNSKIVLLGYSQGASVVTGALYGGQGRPVLAQKYINAIAGLVAIADPSYVAGLQPLDNNSTNTQNNGSFQDGHVQTSLNSGLGKRAASFCASGDAYCANAGTSSAALQIHITEESTWKKAAIAFLQGLNYS